MRGLNFPKFVYGFIFCPTFQKIGTWSRILPTHVDQLFSYGNTVHLKMVRYGSCFMADPPAAPCPGRPLLYLHRTEDSTPSEQIEGHLPEESIQDVFDNPGKPGPKCVVMQVA
jgi:hypothetical protein